MVQAIYELSLPGDNRSGIAVNAPDFKSAEKEAAWAAGVEAVLKVLGPTDMTRVVTALAEAGIVRYI